MFTQMTRRKYELKKRAEQQEQTRQRIVEAAIALHGELGPRDTTISAVAQRAGVQRLTLYRHFADEDALFQACSSYWLEQNPPPDIGDWSDKTAPGEGTHDTLQALYRYYRKTEVTWTYYNRDLEETPALREVMAELEAHLAQARNILLKAWKPTSGRRRDVTITLDHCLRFTTWRSLKEQGLSDKAIATLALRWVSAAMN